MTKFTLFNIPVVIVPLTWIYVFILATMFGPTHLVYFTLATLFVLIHEFGHSLTARKFGCETEQIELTPFGGMAEIQNIHQMSKWQMFCTIMAGPGTNIIMAIIFGSIVGFDISFPKMDFTPFALIKSCFLINCALAIFNMIPLYPMDGGRIMNVIIQTVTSKINAQIITMIISGLLYLFLVGVCVTNSWWIALIIFSIMMFLGVSETIALVKEWRYFSKYKVS